MQSFRTELENPVVEQDILELERKIYAYQTGQMDEDRFRSLRLARGVYGQRQAGVQMVRIKLPYGQVSARQLRRIAQIADTYANGNLHLTTRQDIQLHYVSLADTPRLWAELEQDDITLREACGNTVRNVTASPLAGIDPAEPFDVSPYAEALFQYCLRNPVCQDMGRKFKIAFSSSERDDAYAFVHDLGFIPRLSEEGARGFKVVIGGGIGAQPHHAAVAHEWLAAERLIPFTEAVLRVFDRYGERNRRHKARLKYLLQEVGLTELLRLVDAQTTALPHQEFSIVPPEPPHWPTPIAPTSASQPTDAADYLLWRASNVLTQKQAGYLAVGIKLTTGDLHSATARALADLVETHAQPHEMRLTAQQNILLRFVTEAQLPALYEGLRELGLAAPGYGSMLDIVTCPGTDTCNLGIASSMGLARELERVLWSEFPHLATDKDLSIKISGCMNACGQHTLANIGFQGMTIKAGKLVAPASQLLLGGGSTGGGQGRFADKVLKMPAKRSPEALRRVLHDYQHHRQPAELFNDYYDRQGADYFYQLLKDLSSVEGLGAEDFIDWGNQQPYVTAIGLGECAGVTVDMVATLLLEAEEKLDNARHAQQQQRHADAIYWAYTAMLYAAKGLLTPTDAILNTQQAIIRSFDRYFTDTGEFDLGESFADLILRMNAYPPTAEFADRYLADATCVVGKIRVMRAQQLADVAI